MQNELRLDTLPDLPQRATIVEISTRLWQNDEVVALWLGGSLARGAGDLFSDIDFRVAVAPQDLAAWKTPHFVDIFASSPVVGQQLLTFGEHAFLHHLVLANGEILDFFVQSTTQQPGAEPRVILGCRDEDFAQLLVDEGQIAPGETRGEIEAAEVQRLLTMFWINTHKHRKVLHRGLDLMVNFGIDVETSLLLRLWYIEMSGKDCGELRRQTIHALTRTIRTLEQNAGDEVRGVVGEPTRDRQEIYHAIERNREMVSRLGRSLAQKYGFAYPADLEATVLRGWQDFIAAQ